MAKKRESRQKSRQSDAIRGGKKPAKGDRDTDRDSDPFAVLAREWTNDRVKLRRVREWAERVAKRKGSLWAAVEASLAKEVLAILNGTERKGKR